MKTSDLETMFICYIDYIKNAKISVDLLDQSGEVQNLISIAKTLANTIKDNLYTKDKNKYNNACRSKVSPLAAKVLVPFLTTFCHKEDLNTFAGNEITRNLLLEAIIFGFYLHKHLTQKQLAIATKEEILTDEEMEKFTKLRAMTSFISIAQELGYSIDEALETLIKENYLTREDMELIGSESLLKRFDEFMKKKQKNQNTENLKEDDKSNLS